MQFAPIALANGQADRADAWTAHAEKLRAAIEAQAWDGEWYRRAYFDDGTPVGSAKSLECKIDSLAQTWAVISRAGRSDRALQAMRSLEKFLIRTPDQLVLLFTPPFDKIPLDPGYIKGYLPGVRENGGQYTHAAAWSVIAFAMMGDGQRAFETFSLLNPIHHSLTREAAEIYKIEPYVLAGDVYSQMPHVGRGGWSWYTGSSGWIYRAGLESILGFSISGNELSLDPRLPAEWNSFSIRYRHGKSTVFEISVSVSESASAPSALASGLLLDGKEASWPLKLMDDGRVHAVTVSLAKAPRAAN